MSFVRSNVVRRAAAIQQAPQPTAASHHSATSQITPATHSTTAVASASSTHSPSNAVPSAFSLLPSSLLPSSTPPTPPPSVVLPGTRSWLHSLTFVPSGLADLDSLLSGGLYLHSLVTVAEDESGQWDAFTRLFAAEAAEWQQPVLTISTRTAALERDWMQHLPRAIKHRTDTKPRPDTERSDSLRIAWRYGAYKDRPQDAQSNMRASSMVAATGQRSHSLSHTFNLRLPTSHSADHLASLHSHIQVTDGGGQLWTGLYERVSSELERLCGGGDQGSTGRVVRLIIRTAADIDWCVNDTTDESHRHFLLFLHRLRGLLHHHPAICLLTYPPAILSAPTTSTIHHLSTLALTLHTLPPTSPYRHYDCLLTIHPQPPIHSLVSEAGGGGDGSEWLVECREVVRLDKVSLPPEESRNEDGQGQGLAQQVAVNGRERGKVEVENEAAAALLAANANGVGNVGGGKASAAMKDVQRHHHARGGMGCGSGGGSDW